MRQEIFLQLEELEVRLLLSTVQVLAAGVEGTEILQLQVDGQNVQAWSVGGDAYAGLFETFEFTTADTISADQVRLAFVNDQYNPSIGLDSNVRVDAIVIDGVRYDAEGINVFSTGTWLPELGISDGFHETEMLHTNGYLQFSSKDESGSLIRFRVAGDRGEEQFDLQIDGQTVQSYSAGDGFIVYSFRADRLIAVDQIRLVFTNDQYLPQQGIDRNLNVDWVEVDGLRVQTSNSNIFSTGTWLPEDGVSGGFGRGQILHANGYLQFDEHDFNGTGSTIVVRASGDVGGEQLALQIDEQDVAFFDVTTEFVEYSFVADLIIEANQVRVRYTNDIFSPGIDRNLNVDWIEIDGIRFETESDEVFSTGTFTNEDGIVAGVGRGSTLHVQGYFEYGRSSDNLPLNFNGLPVYERNGHLYFRTSGGLNWEQAQAEAQSFGGNLVTINSADEEQFIQSIFGSNAVFIGLNDLGIEDQYSWVSGEQSFYRNWNPGQPPVVSGSNNYVLMNTQEQFQWEVVDIQISHFGIIEIVTGI